MQINQSYYTLRDSLEPLYGLAESTQIARWLIEHLTGWSRADLLVHGSDAFNAEQAVLFDKYQRELLQWRPVQYVLGEAWFAGMRFYVDERVLIPRPETEELVGWLVESAGSAMLDLRSKKYETETGTSYFPNLTSDLRILDIGTGSGCIAIALKKSLPQAEVWAVDKSTEALDVSRRNAADLGTQIHFREMDILDPQQTGNLPEFDLIVSNPPYVPMSDMESMRSNVRDHEPHLALFVENDDALLFYRVIANLGLTKLRPGGRLFFEMHALAGHAVRDLLSSLGYRDIELRKDLGGCDRMIAATRP
jgi:release factor glutamine methyltransferase